jgi:cytochrome oxidase Cu insertion factor (SCO1/SenC/PrrC family)
MHINLGFGHTIWRILHTNCTSIWVSCTPIALQLALAALPGIFLAGCTSTPADDDLYPVGNFTLTERSGRIVRDRDLLGKVWVASFIFTRCAGPCARVSACMAEMQKELGDIPNVVLVTFTVDPEFDRPPILREYAAHFGADSSRWLFLTGEPKEVYALIRNGFHLTAQPNEGENRTAGNEIMHDTRLAIVDRRGHIRAYVQATDEDAVTQAASKVRALLQEK